MSLKKIYIYFFIAAAIVFSIGFIFYDYDSTFVINIHDTYFVIRSLELIHSVSLLLFVIGLV